MSLSATTAPLPTSDLDLDPDCVVCYRLLLEPARLPCGHVLCLTCVEELRHRAGAACPLCRRDFRRFHPAIDAAALAIVQQHRKDSFTAEFSRRKLSGELEQLWQRLRVNIGNTALPLLSPDFDGALLPVFEWTLYVNCEDLDSAQLIQKVRVQLPESYGGQAVDLFYPFQFTGVGTAPFTVGAKVYWQPWLEQPICSAKHRVELESEMAESFFILRVARELLDTNL